MQYKRQLGRARQAQSSNDSMTASACTQTALLKSLVVLGSRILL